MHLFISAGEPSGDLHASNLMRALRARHPQVRFSGFGGERMEAAGLKLLFPLTRHAVMGFVRALAKIFVFLRLARMANRCFLTQRPHAVILIDFAGFNFALARRAHAAGIPVYWFMPPQLWAWRGWRVRNVRRWVDHVLCALPFEHRWYRKRHVACSYVGHPYFDELAREVPDAEFMVAQRQQGGRVVALLPGSRLQEVTKNAESMLRAAGAIHARQPHSRFLVAAFNESQAQIIRQLPEVGGLPVEVHVGRTPEIIRLAEACISVSGSVGLELMYSGVPTVVLYRVTRVQRAMAKRLIKIRYMSLVNLLAGEELYPEFPVVHDPFAEMAGRVLSWLEDEPARLQVQARLRELCAKYARTGACERAAETVLQQLQMRRAS